MPSKLPPHPAPSQFPHPPRTSPPPSQLCPCPSQLHPLPKPSQFQSSPSPQPHNFPLPHAFSLLFSTSPSPISNSSPVRNCLDLKHPGPPLHPDRSLNPGRCWCGHRRESFLTGCPWLHISSLPGYCLLWFDRNEPHPHSGCTVHQELHLSLSMYCSFTSQTPGVPLAVTSPPLPPHICLHLVPCCQQWPLHLHLSLRWHGPTFNHLVKYDFQ